MCLATPHRAWYFALLTTLTSVAGGLFGYAIGYFALDALLPFTLASVIGRGMRFFLVAGLMAWGGARMEALLHRYVDRLGWATVALVGLGVLWYGSR